MKQFFACVFLLAAGGLDLQAGNIVYNSSFDSNLGGWTLINFWQDSLGRSDTYSVGTGCVGDQCVVPGSGYEAYILQNLPTVASQEYDLSFWITEDAGPTSEMAVYWDGNLVADVLNPNNSTDGGGEGSTYAPWKQFTYTNLVATTNSTPLMILGRQDPAGLYIDDVVVDDASSSVPEPGSILLLGGGMGMLLLLRRRGIC